MKALFRSILMFLSVAALALPAVGQAGWAASSTKLPHEGYIRHVDRTVLGEDVVHYRFEVSVGPGEFDRIQLHRIVREKHSYQPVHTVNSLFLFPGSPNSVEMIFMEPVISSVPAWDQSITAFLAKNNIDVWAMDYRWALVPAGTTDFKFMKSWGVARDVKDARNALSIARMIRGATGQGLGQLNVLGFSYGVYIIYSIANQETQLPRALRNAKGLVAVDWGMEFPDGSDVKTTGCNMASQYQSLLDAGVYDDSTGVTLKQFADLAQSSPGNPSPFAPGFTNYEFLMFVGASPTPPPPNWHFVAGVFNDSGISTGLQYTDPQAWIDILRAVPPHMPTRVNVEANQINCYQGLAPFEDHLRKITLPILYVGAAGGTGELGYDTLPFTASHDITKFTVQLHPDDQAALDYGHADLFTATNAETLAWQPILDWLGTHR